ncbi:MAG: hypothetical protein AMJ68_09010 [Acidithiobacillales bacterium SG8_45]|nr:MAG: hypothetical protein AMJ68_09010 [Acidithiobacillales bacterium SG8_45]
MAARKAKLDKIIPDLKVTTTGDKSFKLSELRGHKVVLYFYPKDNTPGCTTEGQDFRDAHGKFKRKNTIVQAKQSFPFDLISDPDEKLCNAFDVIKEKNMYGKKVMGIERSTFIIDEKGILRKEFRKVKVAGHVEAVLEAIKEL